MLNKNKIILGSSGISMIPLSYYSYINNFYILALLLGVNSIISPLFWYKYKINSIEYICDNILSLSSILYISFYSYLYNYLTIISIISHVSKILTFNILYYKFNNINYYNHQLCIYLIYRFLYNSFILIFIFKNNYYIINKYNNLFIINNFYLIIYYYNNIANNIFYTEFLLAMQHTIIIYLTNEIIVNLY